MLCFSHTSPCRRRVCFASFFPSSTVRCSRLGGSAVKRLGFRLLDFLLVEAHFLCLPLTCLSGCLHSLIGGITMFFSMQVDQKVFSVIACVRRLWSTASGPATCARPRDALIGDLPDVDGVVAEESSHSFQALFQRSFLEKQLVLMLTGEKQSCFRTGHLTLRMVLRKKKTTCRAHK